jgi:hypothetical protein
MCLLDQLLRQYDVTISVNTTASNDLFTISDSMLLNDDLRQYFHLAVAKLLYLGTRMRYPSGSYLANNSSSASYVTRNG